MKTKPQILIVEDERITAEDTRRTLMYLGYAVSPIMSSGKEAFKEVEENTPDLDFDLIFSPSDNGLEFDLTDDTTEEESISDYATTLFSIVLILVILVITIFLLRKKRTTQ